MASMSIEGSTLPAGTPSTFYHNDKYALPQGNGNDAPEVFQPQSQGKPVPPYFPPQTEGRNGRICGLVPSTFWVLLALVAAVIIAAVAGGVAGSMAVNSARDDGYDEAAASCAEANLGATATGTLPTTIFSTVTQTVTPGSSETPSSVSGFEAPTGVALPYDCPDIDGDVMSVNWGQTYQFDVECGVGLSQAEDADESVDIVAVISYHFEDCLRACAVYNRYADSTECVGVTFLADLAIVPTNAGNCYLKREGYVRTDSSDDDEGVVSGVLV